MKPVRNQSTETIVEKESNAKRDKLNTASELVGRSPVLFFGDKTTYMICASFRR